MRILRMEEKLHLEPLSQKVRGKIKVPGVTGFSHAEVEFLLNSGSDVTPISEDFIVKIQKELSGIELTKPFE